MSIVNIIKGWVGEKSAQLGMWLKLDDRIYIRFHNLILQTGNGTTQIDHIVLSRYGIFVIETKNFNGWIYGGEKQKDWTQVLFGKKSRFQNPLHQNYRHTKALSENLGTDHRKIFPLVFFIGDAELKSDFPANVMNRGLSAYIKSFTEILFSDEQLDRLRDRLEQLKDSGISNRQHVRNLNTKYSDTAICPKCGAALVERTAKNSPNAGERFLGCSSYPKCRYIRNL